MQQPAAQIERPDAALIAELEAANIHPLWDRYKSITPVVPAAGDAPMHWRWRNFEPFTARAAAEVPRLSRTASRMGSRASPAVIAALRFMAAILLESRGSVKRPRDPARQRRECAARSAV